MYHTGQIKGVLRKSQKTKRGKERDSAAPKIADLSGGEDRARIGSPHRGGGEEILEKTLKKINWKGRRVERGGGLEGRELIKTKQTKLGFSCLSPAKKTF